MDIQIPDSEVPKKWTFKNSLIYLILLILANLIVGIGLIYINKIVSSQTKPSTPANTSAQSNENNSLGDSTVQTKTENQNPEGKGSKTLIVPSVKPIEDPTLVTTNSTAHNSAPLLKNNSESMITTRTHDPEIESLRKQVSEETDFE